ncbi:uncharacterized protein J4E84_003615 [Alternaria hordeiaustralica]|uniref:uncharacterized protein n=1 Tax=Alternaria hordeiaustralica TaxID=1187925 RepID=UPI0020C2A51B|nr:uncharacterized protein J4E84_003615 [Alternaria hordeiaustralica]KAI4691323.1 hypothetical protein J4E84_003615 [Alternaria hordeiaustralica]
MSVPLKMLEKEVEHPDRIEGWLDKLHIKGAEIDGSECTTDTDGEAGYGPTTPPRRSDYRSVPQDEISPTDTSFSGQSIFDKPLRKDLFGSPTPYLERRDDGSDTTSIDSRDWAPTQGKERTLERPIPPTFALRPSKPSARLDHQKVASHMDTDDLTTVWDLDPQQTLPPNEPRPVWITSCLQCTLSGLPCSRTYPSCSRCKRHNRAEECLLQRRRFASEVMDSSTMERSTAPALLKVKGEDEGVWERKVELAEALCEQWVAEQDKKNWVLPDVGSARGGWGKRKGRAGKEKVGHPGEGIGRLAFRELFVDVDT